MKRSARLSLKKETLAELNGDDMRAVAAGDASAASCYTCPVPCAISPVIHPSVFEPTNCCQGIPTFHRAADAC